MDTERLNAAATEYGETNGLGINEVTNFTEAFKAGANWAVKDEHIETLKTEIVALDALRIADRPILKAETFNLLADKLADYEVLTGSPYQFPVS